MKIAVCFSGLTRNFEDTFSYFKKNLFSINDVDVFVYGSPNKNGYKQNLEKIQELYKPKKIVLNESIFYDEIDKKYNFKDPLGKFWYNVLSANNLKIEYEDENNFKYDYVFRMRFDYFFLRTLDECKINLNQIDDNSVAIPHRWNFSEVHPMAKSDNLAIGTSKSMNQYCKLFENFDFYINKVPKNFHNGSPHAESLLGIYLNDINLNVIQTESPVEYEYPDEIDIDSTDIQYRSSYRKFAFD